MSLSEVREEIVAADKALALEQEQMDREAAELAAELVERIEATSREFGKNSRICLAYNIIAEYLRDSVTGIPRYWHDLTIPHGMHVMAPFIARVLSAAEDRLVHLSALQTLNHKENAWQLAAMSEDPATFLRGHVQPSLRRRGAWLTDPSGVWQKIPRLTIKAIALVDTSKLNMTELREQQAWRIEDLLPAMRSHVGFVEKIEMHITKSLPQIEEKSNGYGKLYRELATILRAREGDVVGDLIDFRAALPAISDCAQVVQVMQLDSLAADAIRFLLVAMRMAAFCQEADVGVCQYLGKFEAEADPTTARRIARIRADIAAHGLDEAEL